MTPPITDVAPESSPAVIDIPRDPAGYAKWRQTGEVPAAKPKAESTPAKETPADGEQPEENSAPASETGKPTQEKKPRGDNAAARLNELLEDLRKAGMTPAELKTFKREAKAEQKAEPANQQAAEHTEKPAERKPPVKPKQEDFKTYDEYDAAKDKYYEDVADFKAAKALDDYRQEQQRNAANQSVHEKMTEAKGRYGDEAVGIISATARAFTGDQQIPATVTSLLDSSAVWTDLLYALGSKPAELASFIQLAKSDPMTAVRKIAVMEDLVKQELTKGGKKAQAASEETDDGASAARDESGKFKKTTPEKQESNAPPPPKELSGRGTPPADEVQRAVKDGDFASYKRAQNARDLARRRG